MKGVITSSLKTYKFKYDKKLFQSNPEYRNDILYTIALIDQSKYL